MLVLLDYLCRYVIFYLLLGTSGAKRKLVVSVQFRHVPYGKPHLSGFRIKFVKIWIVF